MQFGLRTGSGGAGRWRGGDGVRRVLEVSMPMRVSILSERRARAPYGLHGGRDGATGRNTWVRRESAGDVDAAPSSSDEPAAPDLRKLGKTPDELELGDIPVAQRGSRAVNIGGKATLWMGKGDTLVIETPGGGGWGADEEAVEEGVQAGDGRVRWEARGSVAERERAQAGF